MKKIGISQSSEVKFGALFSYILIILNALYGILLTPYIISSLGTDEYGVYKTIASLASSLMVMDFGIGGTVQRYVASYRAKQADDKISNFVAMSLLIAVILNAIIVIVSAAIYFNLGTVYGNTFTNAQIQKARMVFGVLALNMVLVVFENVLNGLISGFNRFCFANGFKVVLLIFRICLIVVLIRIFRSAVTIAAISVIISVCVLLCDYLYIHFNLGLQIKLSNWDGDLLKEAGRYTGLLFVTAIATQIFSNVDNVVIGAFCGPEVVTVYSIGLMFFSMFQSLSAAVAGVMLPTITNALQSKDADRVLQTIIIKAGRVQFIFLGAALVGFIGIGKDFVNVWMGSGYEDVYLITLILLGPSVFELCINVCLSVLRAQNRLGFRTGCVVVSAIINAIVTVVLVKNYSYVGAAIATAVSYISCSLISMNIYYARVIKLPILKIYKGIISRIWICLIISGIVLFNVSRFVYGSWIAITVDIFSFLVVYGILIFTVGLTKDERKQLLKKKNNV